MQAPFAAHAKVGLDAANVTLLSGRVAVESAATDEGLALSMGHEVRALADQVQRAADGVAAIEHGALALDKFHAVDGQRVDRVPVFVRAVPEDGIVEANTVDQSQRAESR